MNVTTVGTTRMISSRIGGVCVAFCSRGMSSDKAAQFGVYQNGVQFCFEADKYQSNKDAFLAARAWNNDWSHFERYGGIVLEKSYFGYYVRPVYIAEVK